MVQPNFQDTVKLAGERSSPRASLQHIGALWLLPDDETTRILRQVVNACPATRSLTFFQPHVTIRSGLTRNIPSAEQIRASALTLGGPFTTEILKVGFDASFFRSVFLECALTDRQNEILHRVGGLQELEGSKPFAPQLKFAGGTLEASERESVSDAFRTELAKITFDRLVFASVPNDEIAWSAIDRWQMTDPELL